MPNKPIIITAFANDYIEGQHLQYLSNEITGIGTALKARKLNTFFEVIPTKL